MAHHKSALKRIRQNIKRTSRNRSLRSDVRTLIKKFRVVIEKKDIEKAREKYPQVQKNIDKAVSKGIIHKKTGARYKSRLSLSITKLATS
tara:strand:+ start:2267 stop:2536 length:270 start_codon:yes stop_codon:yes gene_type:complete